MCAALLVCTMLPASASKISLPYGAFATRPVTGVSVLQDLVRRDSTVVSRYSRHFRMRPSDIRAYFSQNLRMTTLRKPMVASVYYIVGNERILGHKKRLNAGDRVLVARNGTPVIMSPCGNPLAASLPAATKPRPVAKKPVLVTPVPVENAQTPAQLPVQQVAAEPEPAMPPTPVTVAVLSEPPTELVPPIVEPAPQVIASIPAAVTHPNWVLSGLGAIGAISRGVREGHSHNVTPEPSSLITLSVVGLGLLGGQFGRLRRRRSAK